MFTLLHALAFVLGGAALVASSTRIVSRCVTALDLRLLGAGVLTALSMVADSLVLGLARLGTDTTVLLGAAVVTWLLTRTLVTAPEVTVLTQLREGARSLGAPARCAWGAVAGLTVAWSAWLLWRPLVGIDGEQYHLGQPAIWVHDGRPGSLHDLLVVLPLQAYPKSGEVLVSWATATARTPAISAFVMIALHLLGALGVWALCRRVGASTWWSSLLTLALFVSPMPLTQLAGTNTDLIVLCWIAATIALGFAAVGDEPGAAPLVLLAAAMAVSTKTTALPVGVIAVLAVGWRLRGRLRAQRRGLGIAAALALPLAGLWYLQAWVVYGSPLWPFSRFPSGGTQPLYITRLGGTFLHDPVHSWSVATTSGLVNFMAAVLVFAAATGLLLIAFAASRRLRVQAPQVAWLALGALVETVIWGEAPFTGPRGGKEYMQLVVYDTRYLLPGAVLFTAVLAGTVGVRGPIGRLAQAVVVGGLGLDVWGVGEMSVPDRADTVWIVAGLGYGFAAGAAYAVWPRLRLPVGRPGWAWLAAPATAVVVLVAVLLSQVDYIHRSAIAHRRGWALTDASVLAFLDTRADWRTGTATVRIGPYVDALYAGPHLTHPLALVGWDDPCALLREQHQRSWLILTDYPGSFVLMFGRDYSKRLCLGDMKPVFTDGAMSVYAPAVPDRS